MRPLLPLNLRTMKKLFLFGSLALAGYMGWSKYGGTKAPASELPTESPKVVATTPAPTPKRRLAPKGTLFLTVYKSAKTPGGVTGYPPGSQVTVVSEAGTTLTVCAEGQNLIVSNKEVTNDLDIAAAILKADSTEQNELFAKGLAQSNAAAQAKAKELKQETDSFNRRVAMAASQPNYVASYSNPLNRGAYGQTALSAEQLRNLPPVTDANRLSALYSAQARATSADVAALQVSRNAPGANHANIDAQISAKQALERLQWDQSTRVRQDQ